jgi:hypothetical protein
MRSVGSCTCKLEHFCHEQVYRVDQIVGCFCHRCGTFIEAVSYGSSHAVVARYVCLSVLCIITFLPLQGSWSFQFTRSAALQQARSFSISTYSWWYRHGLSRGSLLLRRRMIVVRPCNLLDFGDDLSLRCRLSRKKIEVIREFLSAKEVITD